MTFKCKPLSADVEERKRYHAIFNAWLIQASEAECQQFEDVRDRIAPNEVCSVVSLLRRCLASQELMQLLPPSMLRLLWRERCWPQADADALAP